VLEDTVEDGVVLFLTDDAVQAPITAELLNRSGHGLSQHIAMGERSEEFAALAHGATLS
jgi:hypothetical protein